jgi:hypothetical protein
MEPYKRNAPFPEPSITCLSRVFCIGALPPGTPHAASINREMLISKAFLDMSYVAFGVPTKEALLPGSSHRGATEEHTPVTECSFTVSRSPR